MQKRYNSNPAFLDFMTLVSLAFIALFLMVVPFMNPIADQGKIDPVTQFMINVNWPEESHADIDIHVKGPDGKVVNYQRKDGNFMVLDRDDLGSLNDRYEVNGQKKTVKRNMETITINDIVPGEYFVTIHFFGQGVTSHVLQEGNWVKNPNVSHNEIVQIDFIDMHPFKMFYSTKIDILPRQEIPIISFVVDEDGNVTDIRDDIQIYIFYTGR